MVWVHICSNNTNPAYCKKKCLNVPSGLVRDGAFICEDIWVKQVLPQSWSDVSMQQRQRMPEALKSAVFVTLNMRKKCDNVTSLTAHMIVNCTSKLCFIVFLSLYIFIFMCNHINDLHFVLIFKFCTSVGPTVILLFCCLNCNNSKLNLTFTLLFMRP